MSELSMLRLRWTDAVSEHFEIAQVAWRVTDGYSSETFDDAETELDYMQRLMAKFDELRGA